MVFRKISQDLKERLFWAIDHGYPLQEAIELFGVSERSYWRWKANLRDHGCVVAPPPVLRGRRPILNAIVKRELYQLFEEAAEMYLDEVQEWLIVAQDIGISRTALHENLEDMGLSYKILRKAAAERDEALREAFRQRARDNWVAGQLVFVDETSKDNRTIYRHYGRAASGQRATVRIPFKRGVRYSLVAALSMDGYLSARAVEGSVDGSEFLDFIAEEVLPRMNSFPDENSVLVMDNCAIHKSEALQTLVEAQGSLLVFLPPYSPDLNPIEESFSCLKSHIRRNWEEMQESDDQLVALLEACGYITGDLAKGWIEHSGYTMID